MAKSASVRLLAVLAVAISLDGARRVSAAGITPEVVGSLSKVDGWIERNLKLPEKAKESVDTFRDLVGVAIDKSGDKDAQAPRRQQLTVTDIKVDGETIIPNGEGGGMILITTTVPFPFLNTAAYNLLKEEFPTSKPVGKYGLLCSADQLPPVTLVLDVKGNNVELTRPWQEFKDGSMCLGILHSPWA